MLARFRVSDGEGRDYKRTGEGPVDRNGNLGFLEEKEFGRGIGVKRSNDGCYNTWNLKLRKAGPK